MRNFLAPLLTVTALALVAPGPALAALPFASADYRFNGDLKSTVFGAPLLQHLGPGQNSFATESVFGTSRTVLDFPKDNGLFLTPVSDILGGSAYSIEIVFRLAENSGYRRVIDFENGKSDCGVYLYNGLPRYFCSDGVGPIAIPAGTWIRLIASRQANGMFAVYVDGDLQFSVNDAVAKPHAVILENTLRFFRDNECSAGSCTEDSAGAVSQIRIWGAEFDFSDVLSLETCGDANASGTITAADALLALKTSVGTTWCSKVRCDVNLSATITAADALLILKGSVGSAVIPASCYE